MSNPNMPRGMEPVQHVSGAPWNGATRLCYIPVGDGNAMYVGDPVVLAGSGNTDGTAPTVQLATAGTGNPIMGVITSFLPVYPADMSNLNLQRIYRPALTAQYCHVCCDPTVLYEIQANGDAVIAATSIGQNFNLVNTGGDTTTGLSGWALDSDSGTTTSTLQLKLFSASPKVNNDIASLYAKWLVVININQLFGAAASAAGTAYVGTVGV